MGEMMRRKLSLLFLCVALSWIGTGCSSSKSTVPPINSGLQFTLPTQSPIVEVTNPPETVGLAVNESVTWSIQSGCGIGKPIGTLTNITANTVTYVAPSSSPTSTCNPLQDVVLATDSSNATAALSIKVVATPPTIANASSFTFSGSQCTYAGGSCCPPNASTCCPPASVQTIIQPAPNGVGGPTSRVGVYTDLGPLQISGGVAPYTWQITSGSLPDGLSLSPGTDTTTMAVVGTPTSPGCSTFTLQITDANNVASPAGPFTFNIVVIPPALKLAAPNYPASYNDPTQTGDPGLTFAPLAVSATSGVGPYTWVADNVQSPGSTLPPGLALTNTTTSTVLIQGTPLNGDDTVNNVKGNGPGQYPSAVSVSDGELPYPAVGLANLPNMADLPVAQPCSSSNQAVPIQPLGLSVNGGDPTGGPVAAEAYLQGSVAFLLHGFDDSGVVVIAGSVAVDGNGGITGGEEDVTRSGGTQHLTIQPSSSNSASNYVVGTTTSGAGGLGYTSYSRGCMSLATSAGTTAFAFTLGGCSNGWTENHLTSTNDNACGMTQSGGSNVAAGYFTTGHVIEFDDCPAGKFSYCTSTTRATGILRAQDTSSFSSGLSGPYAFGLSGSDTAAAHYAMAGYFQASSGTLSSIAADIDDAGTLGSQLTGGSGTYSTPDAYGNANGAMSVGSASLPLSLYMISKNEAFFVTTPTSAAPILGGEAISTGTSFSNASLPNTEIFHIGGVSPTGPDVSVGVFSFNGAGSLGGTIYQDQAGTLATTTVSAVYSVDPTTGRAVFSALQQGLTIGAHPLVGYIIPMSPTLTRQACSVPANCIAGFLVGVDSTAQDGVLEFQTTASPPPFTNVYVAGDYSYGVDEFLDPLAPAFEGIVFAQPSGATTTSGTFGANPAAKQSFFQDVSYSCQEQSPQPVCLLLPSQQLNGAYSVSPNGTGTFGGGTASVTNGNVTFYIDESPANLHPSVVVVEQ